MLTLCIRHDGHTIGAHVILRRRCIVLRYQTLQRRLQRCGRVVHAVAPVTLPQVFNVIVFARRVKITVRSVLAAQSIGVIVQDGGLLRVASAGVFSFADQTLRLRPCLRFTQIIVSRGSFRHGSNARVVHDERIESVRS